MQKYEAADTGQIDGQKQEEDQRQDLDKEQGLKVETEPVTGVYLESAVSEQMLS